VCLFSSFQNWRSTAPTSLIQQLLYMVLAVGVFSSLASDKDDFRLALNGLVCVGVFMAIAGMATDYRFLGYNKNGIGASLACCMLVSLELWFSAETPKMRRLLGLAMLILGAGLMFSLSRGAWLGTLLGAISIVCLRRQFRLLIKASLVLVPLIAVGWNLMPQSAKEYATGIDREKNYNIRLRYESLDIAKGYYEQNPVYGMGVGLRKEYDATNIQWLTLAETGVLGLGAFLLIHVVFLRMVWTTRRYFPQTDIRYSCWRSRVL
jgi:O-antigen ligase